MALIMIDELLKIAKKSKTSQPTLRTVNYWTIDNIQYSGVTDRHRAMIVKGGHVNDFGGVNATISVDNGLPVDVNYPNLARIVPDNIHNSGEIEFFTNATEIIKSFGKVVKVTMIESDTDIAVYGTNEDNTKTESRFIGKMLHKYNNRGDDGIEISFNSKYLIDVIDLIKKYSKDKTYNGVVTWGFIDELYPVRIDFGSDITYVLTPIRTY